MKGNLRKPIALLYLLILLFSLLPFPSVSALLWNPGVTFSCDNEYYSVTTPLTLDNISVSTHWCSFNGIGFNITEGFNSWMNFSSIKSYPKTAGGYLLNWTAHKQTGMVVLNQQLNGFKPLYDYILYSNATATAVTSSSSGAFWVNMTINTCNYKIYDPGIPAGWYVSTTGSDTVGTGTLANPFYTLRKAINASTTGDTITMRGGNYDRPGFGTLKYIKINRSHITITNYTGEKVVIDGKYYTLAGSLGMIQLFTYATTYWNNITFYGINFSNCSWNAVMAHAFTGVGSNSNITFSHCDWYNITERAIWMYSEELAPTIPCQDWNINNCTFTRIQNNASMNECIVFMKAKDFIYENNTLQKFTKQGLSLSAGTCNGIVQFNTFNNQYYYSLKLSGESAVDRTVHDIVIRNNLFTGESKNPAVIERALSLNPEQDNNYIYDIDIYNNVFDIDVIAGQSSFPLHVYGAAAMTGQRINNVNFIYNTLYINGGTATSKDIYVAIGPAKVNNFVIANNILVSETSGNQIIFSDLAKAQTNFTLVNNLYKYTSGTTLGSWFTDDASEFEVGSVSGDPDFHDNSTGDLDINLSSPAIGAASAVYTIGYDYVRTARPQVLTYDIGAYERVGGGIIPAAPTATTPGPTSSAVDRSDPISALNITVEDLNADSMDLYFRSNHTGAWVTLSSNLAVFNGTYQSLLPGFVSPGKKWWSVNVTDGAYWTNKTFNFTFIVVALPTSGITLNKVRANWTTSTTVNITWTKGGNCTNTYVYRSTTGYNLGTVLLYSGTNSYFNDTLLDPIVRYYYTLRPYNSVSLLFGEMNNVTLAETENTTITTSLSALFKGWIGTLRSVRANYHYSSTPDFGTTSINITEMKDSYNGTAPYTSGGYYLPNMIGQTFRTGSVDTYLYNVSFYAYRAGALTLAYAYLYNANTTGLPTGGVLDTGSLDVSGLTEFVPQWVTIQMPSYLLNSNTQYAIMFSVSGGPANLLAYSWDNSIPMYAEGNLTTYTSGIGFSNSSLNDLLFRVNTRRPYTYPAGGAISSNTTITATQTLFTTQANLLAGQMYWYYSTANDTGNQNMTRGNTRFTLTNPNVPTFQYLVPNFSNSSVNISWIRGTGANRTVLVRSLVSYPETVADGTIVYNGTGAWSWNSTSFNTSYYFSLFSFTTWGVLSRWSSSVHIPWGGVTFIVYNESKPWQIIGANITVTDRLGLHPIQFTNLYGYYSFNISQIPYGENTLFYVSNTSYHSRLYPITITQNMFYNLSFYLPPIAAPISGPGGNVTPGSYMVQIITTLSGESYEQQLTIDGALVRFYKYLNTTANYTYIGGFVSDGNGQGSIDLYPFQLYMIKISKVGYDNKTDFWTPNIVEQGLIKVFKIVASSVTPPVTEYTDFWTTIVFTATMDDTNTTHIHYYDISGHTINTQIYLYEFYNGTTTFIGSDSKTGNNSFYWNVSLLNYSRTYIVILRFNSTNDFQIPDNKVVLTIYPLHPLGGFNIEERIKDVFGDFNIGGVVFTWIGFFLSFIPLVVLTLFDPAHVGIGIITTGFFMAGIQVVLVTKMGTAPPPLIIVVIPVIIVIGVLYMLAQRNGWL